MRMCQKGFRKRLLALLVALACVVSGTTAAWAIDAPPANTATSACVMDVDSGRILYSQNENAERCIASITKIMTAILVIENNTDFDQVLTASATAAAEDGTSLYLREGDKLTLMTGLYGTMLRSGNDAAVAIAEYTAGSVEKFVEMMNAKAKELGMTHSHFSWPNGLIDEDNYSSAKDMAILSSYAMKNELFAKIVKTWYIETEDGYQIENHNKMLSRDKRCIGIKTGFTTLAGRTLVTCFQNPDNGQRIVIVTLNNYDHYNDHQRLCDWVFDNFQQTTLVKKGTEIATVNSNGEMVPLVAKETVTWPSKDGEADRIVATFSVQSNQGVPMEEGEMAGVMRFYLDKKKIAQTQLIYHYPDQ